MAKGDKYDTMFGGINHGAIGEIIEQDGVEYMIGNPAKKLWKLNRERQAQGLPPLKFRDFPPILPGTEHWEDDDVDYGPITGR